MCRYTVTSGNLVLLFVWDTVCHLDFRSLIKQSQGNKWGFHPILVTSFLVVFSNAVTKILCNGLLIFHFVLSFLPFKRKTSYRKSHNPSEEKPKTKLPKYVMSQADYFWRLYDINVCFIKIRSKHSSNRVYYEFLWNRRYIRINWWNSNAHCSWWCIHRKIDIILNPTNPQSRLLSHTSIWDTLYLISYSNKRGAHSDRHPRGPTKNISPLSLGKYFDWCDLTR